MNPFIDDSALFRLVCNPDYAERAGKYIDSIFEYAHCVMAYQVKIEAAQTLGDPSDPRIMQSEIEAIDKARTCKHDKAISSLSILNRMAKRAGISPIYHGDIDHDSRKDVAHAIFGLCEDILAHSHEGWQMTRQGWVRQ
ncbi:MAG: DUF3232 domain-containing protein [Raoultibacter sp.]